MRPAANSPVGEPEVIELCLGGDVITGKGHVIVFAFGMPFSGIPVSWVAKEETPGLNFLDDLSYPMLVKIREQINLKRPNW